MANSVTIDTFTFKTTNNLYETTIIDFARHDYMVRQNSPSLRPFLNLLAKSQSRIVTDVEWQSLFAEAKLLLSSNTDADFQYFIRLRLMGPWMRQEPNWVGSKLYALPTWQRDTGDVATAAILLAPWLAPEGLAAALANIDRTGNGLLPRDQERLSLWYDPPVPPPGSLSWMLQRHHYSTLMQWRGNLPAWQSVEADYSGSPSWAGRLQQAMCVYGQEGYLAYAADVQRHSSHSQPSILPTLHLYYNLWLAGEKPPVRAR